MSNPELAHAAGCPAELQGHSLKPVHPSNSRPVETSGAGFDWNPSIRTESNSHPEELENRLARATPRNDDLVAWAQQSDSQPVREWWNDTSDPFEADN